MERGYPKNRLHLLFDEVMIRPTALFMPDENMVADFPSETGIRFQVNPCEKSSQLKIEDLHRHS
ncbi:MAG: hypothetical protein AAB316_03345 [Bacteroidota bacterium]